jgi:hypothetical protein
MARITYFEILSNLEKYWTKKEIATFHDRTNKNLSLISSGKVSHPLIHTNSKIQRVIIHPNTTLFYRVDKSKNEVQLITFFNNRMDPALLKKLLNQ